MLDPFFFCRQEVQTSARTTEGARPRARATVTATTEDARPRVTATAAATTTEGARPRHTTAETTASISDFVELNLGKATAREQRNTELTHGTRPRTVNALCNTV